MKLMIDTDSAELSVTDQGTTETLPLYSDQAFKLLSRQWVKVGWNQKYPYTFSWMGRPVIQLPEDMIRMQEVIFNIQPDVIIETGVAHGGSLVFYASLCKAMGKGSIIGIDIEIRPHNKEAMDKHPLREHITLIEGSSTDPKIIHEVKGMIKPTDTTLIILDSNHSYQHVYDELKLYSQFLSTGSYIVATDGIMHDLADVPRGQDDWGTNNPKQAAEQFVGENPNFVIEQPAWPFNESSLQDNITHWPQAWIKKIK